MATMSASQNPPKRPRLSLQIKAISSGPHMRNSRAIAAAVNPSSPTSFNTLSNVYATAIDRATPVTAINTRQKQPLKLQTHNLTPPRQAVQQTPYVATYPETPLTAQPVSPAVAGVQSVHFPSAMTATPPLSAGPVDNGNNSNNSSFSFSAADTANSAAASPAPLAPANPEPASSPASAPAPAPATASWQPTGDHPRRRAAKPLAVPNPSAAALPYVRNRSLQSILRNSPLPPPSAKTPVSPCRQSRRLAEKAARRVGYDSPLERVIITNEYVRSHIDLLAEDNDTPNATSSYVSSPLSALSSSSSISSPADLEAPQPQQHRDGGHTPGPFEEVRRRMAGLVTRTPTDTAASGPQGIRKRRRAEKKRRWVWTIGTPDEDDEDDAEVGGAIAAIRAAAARGVDAATGAPSPPGCQPRTLQSPMDIATPSVEKFDSSEGAVACGDGVPDVIMSEPEAELESEEVHRRAISLTPSELDCDTPVVGMPARGSGLCLEPRAAAMMRLDVEGGMFSPETGSRRDTPVPADLMVMAQ